MSEQILKMKKITLAFFEIVALRLGLTIERTKKKRETRNR